MEIRSAYQEMEKIPAGLSVPEGRVKPFGTSHAVLCAREEIGDAPFAVINADDYYGKDAFRVIYNFLRTTENGQYCMVGYRLDNTVTDHGSVARGVCAVSQDGYLTDIVERTQILKQENGIVFTEDGETFFPLADDTIVSMNMWGLTPDFMDALEKGFPEFLQTAVPKNPMKAEYLLPRSVDARLKSGAATAKVLHSQDRWYGVTYAADKPLVVAALTALGQEGKYPATGLWK